MTAHVSLQAPENIPDPSISHRSTNIDALVIDHACKAFKSGQKRPLWQNLTGNHKPAAAAKTVYAVDDVSLRIRRNEIYGILGTNGSGKSTLIRLVSTLLLPDSGTVTVFGHDVVRDERIVKTMINRVSVEAAFFKKLSPMENLLYAARLYGVEPGHARREIVRILNLLGIKTTRIHSPLEHMSRGMQQKVAIARAFLTSPILMLLDEPTTGLDPRSKHDVQDFILALRQDHDATIVLTSHDMGESDRLCDRLAILNNGRIVLEETPQRLKENYAARHGLATLPSLEDVFMELTGRSLDSDVDEDNENDSSDGLAVTGESA